MLSRSHIPHRRAAAAAAALLSFQVLACSPSEPEKAPDAAPPPSAPASAAAPAAPPPPAPAAEAPAPAAPAPNAAAPGTAPAAAGEPDITQALAGLQAATSDGERIEWLTEIAWIGDPKGIPAAGALLDDGKSPEVVEEAVSTLEDLGGQESIDVLAAYLKRSSNESLKIRTIEALFFLSDEGRALDPVAGMLGDSSPEVRRQAALALGAMGDTNAVPALKGQLEKESNAEVKTAVSKALDQLGGAPAGG